MYFCFLLILTSTFIVVHKMRIGGIMEVRKRFENDKLKKLQIFNGAQLKYIAFVSMLIDHVNNALITPFLNGKEIGRAHV